MLERLQQSRDHAPLLFTSMSLTRQHTASQIRACADVDGSHLLPTASQSCGNFRHTHRLICARLHLRGSLEILMHTTLVIGVPNPGPCQHSANVVEAYTITIWKTKASLPYCSHSDRSSCQSNEAVARPVPLLDPVVASIVNWQQPAVEAQPQPSVLPLLGQSILKHFHMLRPVHTDFNNCGLQPLLHHNREALQSNRNSVPKDTPHLWCQLFSEHTTIRRDGQQAQPPRWLWFGRLSSLRFTRPTSGRSSIAGLSDQLRLLVPWTDSPGKFHKDIDISFY
mmetsp:Transcript_54905/g.100280  ORF Transcript_54905/g.100280 Transcript_54905/m.100280 type:complete len:281 (-) Transcript_54905:40-882(-)